MPKTVDYKKLAEKLQKEVEILKVKLEASFKKGFKAVHAEIKKMEAVYVLWCMNSQEQIFLS